MTSLAIIVGAVPAALHLGPGAEQRAPMATVVIWGTAVSTLLTLYVVPCAYSLLTRLESHRHQREHGEAVRILKSLEGAATISD
jgi:HAE1 family hydrophobic/amphiphilic exporter-1